MQSQGVVRGNATEANSSDTKGWIVGHFMPEGLGLRKDLEVKLWHHEKDLVYPPKEFGGTECITIYGGQLRIEVTLSDGSESVFVLNGHQQDYLILPPMTRKKVVVEEGPSFGVTIRWPSVNGNSKIL